MKVRLFAAASLGVLLASAVAVSAQAAEAAADGPAPAGTEVGEVIITGEKAGRSVQETTASVAVVTTERIEQENIQTFFDIVERTANVASTYGSSGFTIRGVSNIGVSGGGNGGLATVYVDGAPMPDRGLAGGPLDMWDIGQVEILRGPQSTLQGRNALAGAVIIRSTDPTDDWSFKARARADDAEGWSLAVAGGGPIVADQLAFRLSAEKRQEEGFVYNTSRKASEDAVEASTIRGKLLLTPTALPGLEARLTVTHSEHTGAYQFTYARTDVPDYFDNRVVNDDSPNTSDATVDIVTGEIDYAFTDTLSLTSVTSWSRFDNKTTYDGDGGPLNLAYGGNTEEDETLSQELRLNWRGERIEGLLGLYLSKRERTNDSASLTNVETPEATLVGVLTGLFGLDLATATFAAGVYTTALPVIPVNYTSHTPDETSNIALFGDGRWRIAGGLSLLAGFRYDREETTLANDQTTVFAGTYPDPSLYGPLAPIIGGLNMVVDGFVAQANNSSPATTRKFEAFLPKVGAKYDFTDDVSLAFVVQRGYRSGGTTINVARSTAVPYDPEYTWNYELSFRSSWLDDTLTLNANAYYVKWTDQQVMVNLGLNLYDYQTENAGKSRLYGFEVELGHRPSDSFDWYASIGHTDTQFEDFTVNTGSVDVDLSGSEFAFAPHWTLAIGGNWRFGGGFVANLNANYRGDAYSDTGVTQDAYAIKARTLVNGKFSYETERWSASLFVNNAFDEEYIQYNQATFNRAMLGAPRVIGVVLGARW